MGLGHGSTDNDRDIFFISYSRKTFSLHQVLQPRTSRPSPPSSPSFWSSFSFPLPLAKSAREENDRCGPCQPLQPLQLLANPSSLPLMEASRVFVKGLPPTINEADFRKHFSRGQITDIQLKPQRRLGFIGFSTPAEAKQAVKLFNKSFIRMSKISVELARPIADPSLSQPQNAKPGPPSVAALSLGAGRSINEPKQDDKSEAGPKKRKREVNESDPKLQEFLGVMQHAKNSANKIHGMDMVDGTTPGATDGLVAPVPSGDASDDEYETVPSRPSKRVALQPGPGAAPTKPHVSELPRGPPDTMASEEPPADPMSVDEPEKAAPRPADAVATTDEDFLRRNTNRLLDFLDDDEITPVSVDNAQPETAQAPQPSNGPVVSATPSPEPRQTADTVSKAGAKGVNTVDSVESIRRTRRLFIRNMAFTATEEDLKSHLAPFGEIEEVRRFFFRSHNTHLAFNDEPLIGTAYTQVYDDTTRASILVDASNLNMALPPIPHYIALGYLHSR